MVMFVLSIVFLSLPFAQSSQTRVGVAVIDDIWFRAPVEVGSILHFRSVIGYTDANSVLVRVVAEVEDYKTGAKNTTNVFYFTFKTLDGAEVPKVIPRSYKEYVTYLDSRRHFRHGEQGSHHG
jgi:acyl-coenzyme A thioesterase 9